MPAPRHPHADLDCQRCGACCASYRVGFYWAELERWGLDVALTESVSPLYRCMAGTSASAPHCIALAGEVGRTVSCRVYAQRPSPCRELQPGDPQCLRARARWGLDAAPGTAAEAAA